MQENLDFHKHLEYYLKLIPSSNANSSYLFIFASFPELRELDANWGHIYV